MKIVYLLFFADDFIKHIFEITPSLSFAEMFQFFFETYDIFQIVFWVAMCRMVMVRFCCPRASLAVPLHIKVVHFK